MTLQRSSSALRVHTCKSTLRRLWSRPYYLSIQGGALVSPGDRSAESVLEHVSTWDAYARRWRGVLLEEQARLLLSEDAEGAFSEAFAYVRRVPGKQVRPLLVLAACELTRGDPKVAVSTACALEFLHTSSLIFDDLPCMDNS